MEQQENRTGKTGFLLNEFAEEVNVLELPAAERQELLETLNDTATDYPRDKMLTVLFEEQVARTPGNTALFFREQELTYRALNERANQLAAYLEGRGVVRGTLVGLLVERSMEMIIGIIGILKAGGVYLPLDSLYPKRRLQQLLEDSRVMFLLTEAGRGEFLMPEESGAGRLTIIDIRDPAIDGGPKEDRPVAASPEDLAYIIYTSGTTGQPKGVMTRHRSVVNFICGQKKWFGITEADRILQFSTICFDASVEQIWLALLHGAGLVLIDKTALSDNTSFNAYISRCKVTHLHATPSFLGSIELSGQESLKRVVSGGEPCSVPLAAKFYQDYQFYNKYGPTETTVTSLEYRVIAEKEGPVIGVERERAMIPIGRPIQNTRVYILGRHRELLPRGVRGELYIGGEGLAEGYLHDPVKTREKFVEDPFVPGQLLYRTGDLARWLPDGNMEFLGRIDDQVKIRGYRVELGDIASQLQGHWEIKESVVLVREREENSFLVAYYVSAREIPSAELRDYLSGRLPEYMVPSDYVHLDKLPVTGNGKLDRKALPVPAVANKEEYMAPSGAIEERLAEIWSDVLKVNRDLLIVNATLFELGGHSLKATTLAYKMEKEFKIRISIQAIFEKPTIRQQGELLKIHEWLNNENDELEDREKTEVEI